MMEWWNNGGKNQKKPNDLIFFSIQYPIFQYSSLPIFQLRDRRIFQMADIQKIAEEISHLSLLEARDLVKVLEEKFGIKAAQPMAVAAMPVSGVGAGAEAAPPEEKTGFE